MRFFSSLVEYVAFDHREENGVCNYSSLSKILEKYQLQQDRKYENMYPVFLRDNDGVVKTEDTCDDAETATA
jgi:hypothetical protein